MPKGKETIEELKAMMEKYRQAISALETVYGRDDAAPVAARAGDYSRMSLRAGALEVVMGSKEPQSTQSIVDMLIAGGEEMNEKDYWNGVKDAQQYLHRVADEWEGPCPSVTARTMANILRDLASDLLKGVAGQKGNSGV